MAATRKQHSTKRCPKRNQPVAAKVAEVLYLAFELGWNQWKLAFATVAADNPRLKNVAARDTQALLREIARAKKRFGLADDTPVYSCYEAGRDGEVRT